MVHYKEGLEARQKAAAEQAAARKAAQAREQDRRRRSMELAPAVAVKVREVLDSELPDDLRTDYATLARVIAVTLGPSAIPVSNHLPMVCHERLAAFEAKHLGKAE